jgi:RNA polymerase sigma-70 factor (ECF subfamily)
MVYNLALNYVQNVEDAEEITQDVFVKVFQSLETFKQQSSYSTWIYRITINTSLDFIKTKRRQKRFAFFTSLFYEDSGELRYNPIDEFNHPGVLLEDKENLKILYRQINKLPDNQKTALILHKIHKKSQLEVAEIMGLSAKAIESLVQRAKSKLLNHLNKNEGK